MTSSRHALYHHHHHVSYQVSQESTTLHRSRFMMFWISSANIVLHCGCLKPRSTTSLGLPLPLLPIIFFKSSGSPMPLFLYVQRAIFVSFFREDAIKRKCNSPHIPFPIYQSPNTSTGCHCSQIAKHNRLSADVTTTACVQYRSSKHRKKNWHGLPSLKWVPEKVKAAGVIVPTECPSLVCKIWLLAPYTFFFV